MLLLSCFLGACAEHDVSDALAVDDDGDAALPADDGDCDGVPTAEDCDDADPASTVVADDGDCDGVLTGEDCDDGEAAIGVQNVDDPDCDGVPTHAGGGDMIRISAGTFDMGCTPGQSLCGSDESPVMPVTLTHAYYIGETEVTQEQYKALMGYNPSDASNCGMDGPVENITWHMAAAFANAASTSAGLTQCYSCSGSLTLTSCSVAMDPYACDGYRLPTEAEWEGAARCGEDLLYAGSDTVGDVAWYDGNSRYYTSRPVSGLDANACGLYDMSGNVSEWTQDWYDSGYYTGAGRTDPRGASAGIYRVDRGGSWYHTAEYQRVANRFYRTADDRSSQVGMRLARTIAPPAR